MEEGSTKIKDATDAPPQDIPEDEEKQSQLDVFRLKLKKIMTSSTFGKSYTDALLVLSVLSCLQFIYQTYLDVDDPEIADTVNILETAEKFMAGLFSFDWALSFFMADHKSEFVNRYACICH